MSGTDDPIVPTINAKILASSSRVRLRVQIGRFVELHFTKGQVMVTRKTASARPQRTSAGKSVARSPSKKGATKSATDAASVREVVAALERLKLADLSQVLLEGRRKDLEALVAANKKSYDGLQSLVKRRTQQVKTAIAEWQSVAKVMKTAGPGESIAKLDELAKGAFKLALENIRELAELAARSQAETLKIVNQRITESVDQAARMLERR